MFNWSTSTRHGRRRAALMTIVVVTACGGNANNRATAAGQSTSTPATPTSGTSSARTTTSPSTAPTGKIWDVKMLGDASGYRFDPATLTIKVGDAVRWTVVSGPPHNVTFWQDSIPTGGSTQLQSDMPQTIGPLTGPLLNTPNETYTIPFVKVPAGTYRYYCTPHLALGMRGKLTIGP
ncbi:MAG TPA: plastocyanin/azurin family copper-binding protein [Gemmatimonadaceae bacterium]|jgi:plastocyanin